MLHPLVLALLLVPLPQTTSRPTPVAPSGTWVPLGPGAWPAAVLGRDGAIHLAYVGGGVVRHARLGAELEGPRAIRPDTTPCLALMERGPRIAAGVDHRLHIAWCEKAEHNALHVTTSDDDGSTFAHDVRVRDVAEHGGEALCDIACDGAGAVYVAWVDSRMENDQNPVSADVFFDVSRDGGRTFGPDREATARGPARCCPCCRPTLLTAAAPLLAVRGGEHNVRDVFLVPLDPLAAGTCPVPDRWEFAGCPMDAPAIAGDPKAALALAWKTKDGVQVALRDKPDQPFAVRKVRGAAHPVLVVDRKGRATLAWQAGDHEIRVASVARSGGEVVLREHALPPQRARLPQLVLDARDQPVLLATADHVFVALRL